jgi:hypothetical protein
MTQSQYGLRAFLLGPVAVAAVCMAKEAEVLRPGKVGFFLRWLDYLGLLKAPLATDEVEVRAIGFLSFTDSRVIATLLYFGVYLAAWAMGFALRAENNGEDSLYLGAGFMCGSVALVQFNYFAGMAAMLAGAAALLHIRSRRDA